MAVIAGADDYEARLGGLSEFRRIGGGAAMVWANEQAAGGEEREQLLLTASFEVTGQADGVTGKAEDGCEAGFVVCGFLVGGDIWWFAGFGFECGVGESN